MVELLPEKKGCSPYCLGCNFFLNKHGLDFVPLEGCPGGKKDKRFKIDACPECNGCIGCVHLINAKRIAESEGKQLEDTAYYKTMYALNECETRCDVCKQCHFDNNSEFEEELKKIIKKQ